MRYLFLFILPLLVSCTTEKAASKYPSYVGDIELNQKIDNPNFKKCGDIKDYSFQYYNDSKGLQFIGEKIAIEKKAEGLRLKSDPNVNGYITIRFLVNCKGESGMFRVQQMNENYEEIIFEKKLTSKLLDFTKNLAGWIPKEIDGKKIDYYQYLTFKIENGKISKILP